NRIIIFSLLFFIFITIGFLEIKNFVSIIVKLVLFFLPVGILFLFYFFQEESKIKHSKIRLIEEKSQELDQKLREIEKGLLDHRQNLLEQCRAIRDDSSCNYFDISKNAIDEFKEKFTNIEALERITVYSQDLKPLFSLDNKGNDKEDPFIFNLAKIIGKTVFKDVVQYKKKGDGLVGMLAGTLLEKNLNMISRQRDDFSALQVGKTNYTLYHDIIEKDPGEGKKKAIFFILVRENDYLKDILKSQAENSHKNYFKKLSDNNENIELAEEDNFLLYFFHPKRIQFTPGGLFIPGSIEKLKKLIKNYSLGEIFHRYHQKRHYERILKTHYELNCPLPAAWWSVLKEKSDANFAGFLPEDFDPNYLMAINHLENYGYTLAMVYPKELINKKIKLDILKLARNLMIIFSVLFFVAIFLLNRVLRPLNKIKGAMQAVENEEYDFKLDIQTKDEIEDLGNTLNTMLKGLAEKEKLHLQKAELKFAFSRFLSPDIVNALEDDPTLLELGGKTSFCSAYFTDIQGFSSFSEVLNPAQLVELLNEYLTEMTDILLDANGTLDKYEGDAIIAFFGAPIANPDNPKDALTVALYMQKRLSYLREKWKSEGDKWPDLVKNMRMRIGINSGEILTGNMGSKNRMNYTMMGDAVNLAARLEGAAKQYGIYTMVSEASLIHYKDLFTFRELDLLRVVGRREPCRVYELLDFVENFSTWEKLLTLYNSGLEHFRKKNFRKAKDFFQWSEKLEENRKISPSLIFQRRCEEIISDPEKETEGQVYDLSEK
ncbi:adenylate/guanylate cyclase domain-containing protein, partial [Candidatus Riflebacteria bacterium]